MRLRALLLAGVLAATACGTTTSVTDRQTAAGGLSAEDPTTTEDGLTSPAAGGGSTDGGGSLPQSAGGGSVSTAPGATSSGRSVSASARARGPGLTATSVRIGALYLENQRAANAAIGAGGAGGGDARDAYNAVIEEINKAGGVAGRKVVPVYHAINATSSTPVDQQLEAACSHFTQDTSVFAILSQNEIMLRCAKRHGAISLASGLASPAVPNTYRTYPWYVELSTINLVRASFVTVDGLDRQRYFTKGSRIGVVAWDYPNYREAVEKGVRPALRARGFDLATQPAYITPPQTINEVGGTTAELGSAVLRFSSDRIDHVMLLDGPAGLCGVGCLTVFFMRAAQSQRYYPRYGLNDNNGPVTLYEAGLLPADQLRGSLAVGWTDYERSFDVGWRVNAARERCYALMRRKGVAMDDPNSRVQARAACDELWFFQAAVKRRGGALNATTIMSWVNALGYRYNSTQVYETHFSATQHDGVGAARHYRFDDGCSCFKYTSTPYRLRPS